MTYKVICPYCNKAAEFVNGETVYPHRKDLHSLNFWKCSSCSAYVGCHKRHPKYNPNGDKPLGRLANFELRTAKRVAHFHFDPLWHFSDMSRTEAYKWLARKLDIDPKDCHIGMFDLETCNKVRQICIDYQASSKEVK